MLFAMREMLLTARIRALPQIIEAEDINECIPLYSCDAAVCILGMDPPEETGVEQWYIAIQDMVERLGEVVLVSNAGNVRLGD